MEAKILTKEQMEYIRGAHGQLSVGEMAQAIKADIWLVSQYARSLGPPPNPEHIKPHKLVRPPANYSNRR